METVSPNYVVEGDIILDQRQSVTYSYHQSTPLRHLGCLGSPLTIF